MRVYNIDQLLDYKVNIYATSLLKHIVLPPLPYEKFPWALTCTVLNYFHKYYFAYSTEGTFLLYFLAILKFPKKYLLGIDSNQ